MAGTDDAVAAMARSILAEKRARKAAEDDALRLYNRVRQLQKEEDRAQKRIVETKKKAKEIIKLRERNEQKLIEKEQRMREEAEKVEEQKLDNLKQKEEALRHRIEQENKVYQDKLEVVQKTKEERAEIERLLAESRLLARKEALEQKDTIRKQQEDARRKIETLKLQKLTAVGWGGGDVVYDTVCRGWCPSTCTPALNFCHILAGPGGVRAASARGDRGQDGEGARNRAPGESGCGLLGQQRGSACIGRAASLAYATLMPLPSCLQPDASDYSGCFTL